MTEDEHGIDEKIIAVPDNEVYPYNETINNINDNQFFYALQGY
jgi:inorganic pyrophosphatase